MTALALHSLDSQSCGGETDPSEDSGGPEWAEMRQRSLKGALNPA